MNKAIATAAMLGGSYRESVIHAPPKVVRHPMGGWTLAFRINPATTARIYHGWYPCRHCAQAVAAKQAVPGAAGVS